MNTKSRIKSLNITATLRVEVPQVRARFNWRKLRWVGEAAVVVEGAAPIWLGPGDTLDINHHVRESK